MRTGGYRISLAAAALVAASLMIGTSGAKADTVICQEDSVAGCSGIIFGSSPPLTVGSDGESLFDPVGVGSDISDYITLNSSWAAGPNNQWVRLGDTFTWYIPADLSGIGCGSENETICEPVGNWFFEGATWQSAVSPFLQTILDAEGGVSDLILLDNNGGANANSAEIFFFSDPSVPVPEPLTLSLFGAGIAGAAALRRRRRKTA